MKRVLPIGRRAWWNDPKGPTTDAPESKWKGEPARRIAKLEPVKLGVRGKDVRREPPGFFEFLVDMIPLLPTTESTRLKAHNQLTNRVRRALLQEARPVALNYSKPGGLDRIRGPKLNPRLPALVPEALPPMLVHRMRATPGPALAVARVDALDALARNGITVDMAGVRGRLPIGRGFQTLGVR